MKSRVHLVTSKLAKGIEMEDEVKLLGAPLSSFYHRAMWALELKGVPYEFIQEDIHNKSPLLLELNPVHKKIPVLVHNGKAVCESLVILEYIDETWPQNPLLPEDPHERAVARFWAKFADDDKGISIWKVFISAGEEQEKARKESLEYLGMIENHAFTRGSKFLGGENIGFADLALGKIIWLDVIEEVAGVKLLGPEMFPKLHAWLHNFKDVPAIKENLPGRNMMLSAVKERREMILATA